MTEQQIICPGCESKMGNGIHYDQECQNTSCGKWFYEKEKQS